MIWKQVPLVIEGVVACAYHSHSKFLFYRDVEDCYHKVRGSGRTFCL